MTPIELRFVPHRPWDYYIVEYRIKDFIPKEILPTNIFQKYIYKIFNIKRYTKNNWTPITEFVYNYNDKWIYDNHPSNYLDHLSIFYNKIDEFKKKFRNIEDIKSFEENEMKKYFNMIKLYNEKCKKLNDIIY